MSETRPKYGSRRVEVDGYRFDSKAEARRYGELKLLAENEVIYGLIVHPCFTLVKAVKLHGRWKPPIRYEADFSYYDGLTGLHIVEDVKSAATRKNAVYRLKLHLMLAIREIEVREVES